MDNEEILQLVADDELDPSEIEDFKGLTGELQKMVVDGEIDLEEAIEMNE